FNDNSIDPARWSADRVSGPVGVSFAEQSAHLEMLSMTGSPDQSMIFHDSKLAPPYNQTWNVSVGAYNLVDINTSPSARLGLPVSSPGLDHTTGIALKADDGFRRLQGFDGESFGPDFLDGPPDDLAN